MRFNINKQNIIVELASPEKWVNDISQILKSEKIELPSNNELKKWTLTDHIDNDISNKTLNIFNKFFIRGYHACRPFNVNDYYHNGLKVPDKKMYCYLFDEYINKLRITLTKEQYKRGKEAIEISNLDKNIYFLLLPEDLLKNAGHYLVYGSEKMIYAFIKALDSHKVHDSLEDTIGKATIIEANIPINLLSKYHQKLVCAHTLLSLKAYKDNNQYETSSCIWLGFNIEPKYIASHTHPQEAFNPLKWRTVKLRDNEYAK